MRIHIVVASVLLIFGCTALTKFRPLPVDAKENLKVVSVYMEIPQDNLGAEFDESNISGVSGGGLIFAIIDEWTNYSRAKEATIVLSPLQKDVDISSFTREIGNVFQEGMSDNIVLGVPKVNRHHSDSKEFWDFFNRENSDAVLYVNLEFFISSDLRTLKIFASPRLIPKTQPLKDMQLTMYPLANKSKKNTLASETLHRFALYSNQIEYRLTIARNLTKNEALSYWRENGARRIRSGFVEGAEAVVKIIEDDMGKKGVKFRSTDPIKAPIGESYKMKINDSEIIVHRHLDGSLQAVSLI